MRGRVEAEDKCDDLLCNFRGRLNCQAGEIFEDNLYDRLRDRNRLLLECNHPFDAAFFFKQGVQKAVILQDIKLSE